MAFDWRSLLAPRLPAIAAISSGHSPAPALLTKWLLPRHLHIVDLSCSGPSFERPLHWPWAVCVAFVQAQVAVDLAFL